MLKTGHLLIADIFVWNGRSPQKTLISSQNNGQKVQTTVNKKHQELASQAITIENYPTIVGTLERYGNYIKCN